MKTFQTSAVVALMTAAIGLSAIAPSYAQDATPPAPPATRPMPAPGVDPMGNMRPHDGPGQAGPRQNGPRGMAGFIGFERGAEAVEIALVRLSHAIDMTAEQQALYDTLKTDTLAAAEKFSAAVEGLRPAAPAEGQTAQRFDISKGLETRIALETAHLDALKAVQPSVTAFFDSLTDEQKAELTAARAERGPMGKRGQHDAQSQHRWHQDGQRQGGQRSGQGKGAMDVAPVAPPTKG
tara:strand:+ start:187 stop:897 length:711 start_codon:yes stop_codon:yes gene_type:complete